MNVTAGILTWNPTTNQRADLLDQTVASLARADQVTVFDNGSTDDITTTTDLVRFPRIPGFPHANTCGYGMNKMVRRLDGDIVVMSNDDIIWHPDAIPTLRAVWREAPDDLTIISGLVEPTFALPGEEPWNKPYGAIKIAGHDLLLRKSVPGGAWTFRQQHADRIFPVSTFPGVDDVPACHQLLQNQHVVACMDLADHAGVGQSTWGNASHERFIVQTREAVREEFGV